jgi:hypothetical protein
MFSRSLTKDIMVFSSGFNELHAKVDADTCSVLPCIVDKVKHKVEKALM